MLSTKGLPRLRALRPVRSLSVKSGAITVLCLLGAVAAQTEFDSEDLTVSISRSDHTELTASVGGSLFLHAGEPFQSVQLLSQVPFPSASVVRIKITNQSGSCDPSLSPGQFSPAIWGQAGAPATELPGSLAINATEGLTFLMGGTYWLCFIQDGKRSLLNISLDVAGVYDECGLPGCLAQRRHHCPALPGATCLVAFSGAGAGVRGTLGEVALSPAWVAAWDSSSGFESFVRSEDCAAVPCWGGAGCTGLQAAPAGQSLGYSLPAQSEAAATFTVCYCAAADDDCSALHRYTQEVGVLHYFVAKLCLWGDQQCARGYRAVAPGQGFVVLVECPPGACAPDGHSRVNLVDVQPGDELPSPAAQGLCGWREQTPLLRRPVNCESSRRCLASGGNRQDWLRFDNNVTTPFVLRGHGSDYEALNFHAAQTLHICLCLDGCGSAVNWFRAGQLSLSPYRLLGNTSNSSAQMMTVNASGSLALALAQDSVLGLTTGAQIKLLLETDVPLGDDDCRRLAGETHLGHEEGQALMFGLEDGPLNALQAGVVAVCYCHGSECGAEAAGWLLAVRLTISGPEQDQRWVFSTGVNVQLTYRGHGLGPSNTLRIVPRGADCEGDPQPDVSVQVGCPMSCSLPEYLPTRPLDFSSVGCFGNAKVACRTVHITGVVVLDETTTELSFGGSPDLRTGDRVQLLGGIHCVVNCTTEHLAALGGARSYADGGSYWVALPVTATRDSHRFTLPVGWAEPRPQFAVAAERGQWRCTSRASTPEGLMNAQEGTDLGLCWASDAASSQFTAQVGTVSFVPPPAMTAAAVSPTTVAKGVVAPLVVSFTTGLSGMYGDSGRATELMLSFTDVNGLEPHAADGQTLGVASASATQAPCGKLFLELASLDASGGFPMPRACRYRLQGITSEISLSFDSGNGLEAGRHYQLVLVATAKQDLPPGREAVVALVMDDMVMNPYGVIERGSASLDKQLMPAATGTTPRFRLDIMGGSGALLELGSSLDLSVQLAGDGQGQITQESILRLYMMPLTQWNLQYTLPGQSQCSVSCTPHVQTVCGQVSQCAVEPVVASMHPNVVKMRLPVGMTPITQVVQHTLRLRGLSTPVGGFFATRFYAQLTTREDAFPDFVATAGDLLWKTPSPGTTVASLLVTDGNDHPFEGDERNSLYVRLQLAATLRRNQAPSSSASLSVALPQGYAGLRIAAAPGGLLAFDFDAPNAPRNGNPLPQRWSCSGATCSCYLEGEEMIPAGTDLVLSVMVNNPAATMRPEDPRNTWSVSVLGTGEHSVPQAFPAVMFQSSGVGVLGKLLDARLQPTLFALSQDGSSQVLQELFIFFRPKSLVEPGGSVLVDAPRLFNFGDPCEHSDLPASYYVPAVKATETCWMLPAVPHCHSLLRYPSSSTRDRAQMQLARFLQAQRRYGFQLRVANPSIFVASQLTEWALSTTAANSQLVDSTPPRSLPAWGLYAGEIAEVTVGLSSMRPYSLSWQEAAVTIFLRTGEDVQSSLRVTAPQGYEWHFSGQDFVRRTEGATADLPGGLPGRSGNLLLWPVAHYAAAELYGFRARARVPDHSPRGASNAFFVEFGYGEQVLVRGSARALAARAEAPMVRALEDVRVDYTTNVRGRPTVVRLQVAIVTPIPEAGGLLVQGPPGFIFPATCQAEPAALGQPKDVSCRFRPASGEGSCELLLLAGPSGIQPGRLAFQLAGINPQVMMASQPSTRSACGWTWCWTFFSLQDATGLQSAHELDLRASVKSFAVKEEMPHAALVSLSPAAKQATGRDDRPTKANRLTFGFQLGSSAAVGSDLLLRGPAGFLFEEDCLANEGVLTEVWQLPTMGAVLLSQETTWSAGFQVLACAGSDGAATMEIGSELLGHTSYHFLIKVQANPAAVPSNNMWVLETAKEASLETEGFPLATFLAASVSPSRPSATHAGRSVLDYVNMTFQPSSSLPAPGGTLRLTAPAGFALVKSSKTCPLWLEEAGHAQADAAFAGSDLTCDVAGDATVLVIELTGTRPILAGRHYTLVAEVVGPPAVTQAAAWRLESFTSKSGAPLDLGILSGFDVVQALTHYSYWDAGESMRHGGRQVHSLQLQLAFPEAVAAGNAITVVAPVGYTLSDPLDGCRNHTWNAGDPLNQGVALHCDGRTMTVLLGDMWNEVAADSELMLLLDVQNPLQSPSWVENFWRIHLYSQQGDVVASDAVEGWTVIPPLTAVALGLHGTAVPAGSLAVLDLTFTASRAAYALHLDSEEPAGFSFASSQLLLPGQHLVRASGASVRCNVSIIAGLQSLVRFAQVRLPPKGGATVFSLATYALNGDVVERSLNVDGPRLPGQLHVTRADLLSAQQLHSGAHPVPVLWGARLGEPAEAQLAFHLPFPAQPGQSLEVHMPGLVVAGEEAVSITHGETGDSVLLAAVHGAGNTLRAELGGHLAADQSFDLHVKVLAHQAEAFVQPWRAQIQDGGVLPLSLNSAVMTHFVFVHPFVLSVSSSRTPPMAEVDVTLQVSFGTALPLATLSVVAPEGFAFRANCLVAGGARVSSCGPGPPVEGHPSALLSLVGGPPIVQLQGLILKTIAPRKSPVAWSWFLEGRDADGLQLGWGQDGTGLEVQQMRDVSVLYSSAPDVQTQAVVGFRTSRPTGPGGQLQLLLPSGFEASCADAVDGLRTMSLGPLRACEVHGSDLVLTLDEVLEVGHHAFAVGIKTPASTPEENLFSLLLVNAEQAVQDAALDMKGHTIREGLALRSTPLQWTSTDAGQASLVTLGFQVTQEIPFNTLGRLLITFPENVAHALERECSVESTNDNLPLLQLGAGHCGFADVRYLDRLLLQLDPNRAIPPGIYEFKIPVTVPRELPIYNVWLLTFCGFASRRCQQAHSAEGLLTIPLAGFSFGDKSPNAAGLDAGGSVNNAAGQLSLLCLVVLLLSS